MSAILTALADKYYFRRCFQAKYCNQVLIFFSLMSLGLHGDCTFYCIQRLSVLKFFCSFLNYAGIASDKAGTVAFLYKSDVYIHNTAPVRSSS